MKGSNIKRYSLKKFNEDIEKLKQLHDLSTIETIIATVSISALVLGITIWQNAEGNFSWLFFGGILIIMAVYPAWIVVSSFLSKEHNKILNLEIIILVSGAQLIVVLLGFGIVILTNIPDIKNILQMFGVSHPNLFLYFIIFKGIGSFVYYWRFHLVPDFEERRFSLLFEKKEPKFKFIDKIREKFNILLRKYYYIIILAFYMVFIIWGFLLNEYLQIVVIIFIGFITSCLIYFYKRQIKKDC